MTALPDDFADARSRWLAGLCPCCGSDIYEWDWQGRVYQPQPIAEGVRLCGRCVGNDHHTSDGFLPRLLASLIP